MTQTEYLADGHLLLITNRDGDRAILELDTFEVVRVEEETRQALIDLFGYYGYAEQVENIL